MKFTVMPFAVIAMGVAGTSVAGPVTGAAKDRLINEAKAAISEDFKDPSSAQFRNIWITYEPEIDKSTVCGEVNAKNSFGAYVGFAPFTYRTKDLKAIKDVSDSFQATMVDLFCSEERRAK